MKEKDRQSQRVDDKSDIPGWSVWRQDDNGNVALVKAGLTRTEALRLTADLESRGHKQTYWAQEKQ
jgi:hypothetical protein